MRGENLPDLDGEEPQWFVPVVVSHCREDKDKGAKFVFGSYAGALMRLFPGGKPSLVLDCVFHASIKDRMKDAEFKAFIFGAQVSSSTSLRFNIHSQSSPCSASKHARPFHCLARLAPPTFVVKAHFCHERCSFLRLYIHRDIRSALLSMRIWRPRSIKSSSRRSSLLSLPKAS
jgi:hypothetical protein